MKDLGGEIESISTIAFSLAYNHLKLRAVMFLLTFMTAEGASPRPQSTPCFYSSPELTSQTLEKAFPTIGKSDKPPDCTKSYQEILI